MQNPERESKAEDTIEIPNSTKEFVNKPPSPNVRLEETQESVRKITSWNVLTNDRN